MLGPSVVEVDQYAACIALDAALIEQSVSLHALVSIGYGSIGLVWCDDSFPTQRSSVACWIAFVCIHSSTSEDLLLSFEAVFACLTNTTACLVLRV